MTSITKKQKMSPIKKSKKKISYRFLAYESFDVFRFHFKNKLFSPTLINLIFFYKKKPKQKKQQKQINKIK